MLSNWRTTPIKYNPTTTTLHKKPIEIGISKMLRMVLSIAAMILMTRKYVENWLLWVIINVISVVIFALQGVYAMSLEYMILTVIALNGSRMWINSARERGSRALSH